MAKIASLCGDNLHIYSGNDDQIVPLLSMGGKGVISVLAHVAPRETHDICQLFFDGKIEQSRQLQLELLELINALFSDVNPIPVKAALHFMDFCELEYRLPLCPPSNKTQYRLYEALREYQLV